MQEHELDGFADAYGPGFEFHDENLAMLSWYASRMVRALREAGTRSLISLGIGHRVVIRTLVESLVPQLGRYTVVEGSLRAIDELRRGQDLPDNVEVVHALFEDYAPAHPVDAVEMGFVLEHVAEPLPLLRRYVEFLEPGGLAVIVVPNARSLHRLFGQRAGLLDDVYRLSEHDLKLGHRRYFDLDSISRLVREAGLTPRRAEGVYLKCLTTRQIESLSLPPQVQRAFYEVGVDHPDIANAIYLETVR